MPLFRVIFFMSLLLTLNGLFCLGNIEYMFCCQVPECFSMLSVRCCWCTDWMLFLVEKKHNTHTNLFMAPWE